MCAIYGNTIIILKKIPTCLYIIGKTQNDIDREVEFIEYILTASAQMDP